MSLAADAQQSLEGSAIPEPRGWLRTRAQLSMKDRLFSKNILRSGDMWSRGTATWKSTFVSAIFALGAVYFVYVLFLTPNVSRSKPILQLNTMLADAADARQDNHDSDEYEDEEQSSRSTGFLANSKERLALRSLLGRNDLSKRSSIVRITSSDPTSSLCEHPMQVDLEPTARRSFWPAPVSNASPSDSSNPNSPILSSAALSAQRSSSSSPSPSRARRRKESGRLHSASPSRSPVPLRPQRMRPVDARSPLGRTGAARSKRNSTSSLSSNNTDRSSGHSDESAVVEDTLATGDTLDAGSDDDQLPGTPSMASEGSSISAALGHASANPDRDDAQSRSSSSPSPTSSTFSIGRAPSILKRRPQSFHTASLREIDISHSLTQRKDSLTMYGGLGPGLSPQQQQELLQASGIFLPFGPGSPSPPPYQPSLPGTEPMVETSWSQFSKKRSIKLVEPDWIPHLDSHIRARERLETAARFAALKEHSNAHGTLDGDSKYDPDSLDADDFWFERFTQSTAAAGRDWDWRKRRARLQRAAALGMALGQSGFAPSPGDAHMPGKVGLTDVQLQQQQQGAVPMPAAQAASSVRKQMPAAPLITFTEQELSTAPNLKIDTESGRRSMPRGSSEASRSPTNHVNATPLSPTPTGTGTPLGGYFEAGDPAANNISVVMAARVAQRRRASADVGSSQPTSPGGSRRGIVNKITRRTLSASASAGFPSSPGPGSPNGSPLTSPSAEGVGTSPFREIAPSPLSSHYRSSSEQIRSFSPEAGPSSPSSMSPSNSVPGRLSSLGGAMTRNVSLTNLRAGLRRGSGSGAGSDFLPDSTGIELVPDSPDLRSSAPLGDDSYSNGDSSTEGPRSSADAYSHNARSSDAPVRPSTKRSDSYQRSAQPAQEEARPRKAQPPLFRNGSSFTRQSSAPPPSTYNTDAIEELRHDAEQDSISSDSLSSDSLRRRMRARSHTDSSPSTDSFSTRGSITARKEGLVALSSGLSTSPPSVKARARTGSRSSIMRSATGASTDLNRSAKRRSSIRGGSLGSDTSSVGSRNSSLRHGSPKQSSTWTYTLDTNATSSSPSLIQSEFKHNMLRSLASASRPTVWADVGVARTFTSNAIALGKSGSTSNTPSASSSTSSSAASLSSSTSSKPPPTPSTSSSSSTAPSSSSTSKPLVRDSSTSPEQLNTLPLPYLSFAIGVPTPPSASSSTWSETRDRLTSTDYRMASRKAIVTEATRGYFHDFHAIKSHGGKTWRAPSTLIRSDRSLYFPKFTGTRLSDKAKTNTVDMLRNKISVVALLGSKISEEHTRSFYSDTLQAFGSHPKFQLVQINLQSNPLKSYLVSLFLASLRSQIPEELHNTYLLSSQNIELEKEALGYHNKHVGYTYLVDDRGKVRWAGGAFAEEAEKNALKTCTGVLLERFGEKKM